MFYICRSRIRRSFPAVIARRMSGMAINRTSNHAVLAAAILVPLWSMTPAAHGATPNVVYTTDQMVLLLGSYPAEVQLFMDTMAPDPKPIKVNGTNFYVGKVGEVPVAVGIAGPSPAVAEATTRAALTLWPSTSAVVYSGTGGGHSGAVVGDVIVPEQWTDDDGMHRHPLDPTVLEVARNIARSGAVRFATSATLNVSFCPLTPHAERFPILPTKDRPAIRVGGTGLVVTGGDNLFCNDNLGVLFGCNPCPPIDASNPPTANVTPTAFDQTSSDAYVVQDMQTTGSQRAADALKIPFIGFRGVSDPQESGNLWPLVWLGYQQLAADNSARAALAWVQLWADKRHQPTVGASKQHTRAESLQRRPRLQIRYSAAP